MKNLDQKFKFLIKNRYFGALIFKDCELLAPKNETLKLHKYKFTKTYLKQ